MEYIMSQLVVSEGRAHNAMAKTTIPRLPLPQPWRHLTPGHLSACPEATEWMKTYDKPRQYMKKQTLPAKVHIVKAPIVMYLCWELTEVWIHEHTHSSNKYLWSTYAPYWKYSSE